MIVHTMRKKWGRGPAVSEWFVGLWEHEVRSNPSYHHGIDDCMPRGFRMGKVEHIVQKMLRMENKIWHLEI